MNTESTMLKHIMNVGGRSCYEVDTKMLRTWDRATIAQRGCIVLEKVYCETGKPMSGLNARGNQSWNGEHNTRHGCLLLWRFNGNVLLFNCLSSKTRRPLFSGAGDHFGDQLIATEMEMIANMILDNLFPPDAFSFPDENVKSFWYNVLSR